MKRYYASLLAIFFSIFILPLAANAGSCGCTQYAPATGNRDSCNFTININSSADCDAKNGTTQTVLGTTFTYSNCKYYIGDNCTCLKSGMFSSTKTCSSDAECNVGVGTSACCNGTCYFDQAALVVHNTGQTGASNFQQNIRITKPILSITIPGVIFSNPNNTLDSEGNVTVPFLAEYLGGVYQFAVVAGSMVAVVVIILNGFRMTISAGGPEKNKATQNIVKAVTGLFILWSSYALFYTINPNLTQLNELKVRYIAPVVLEDEEDSTLSGTTAASEASIVNISGDNMSWGYGVKVDQSILNMLSQVAQNLKSQDIRLYVASGYRSVDSQKSLISENCQNPAGSQTCNPYPGKPNTCILRDLDPKNCPHTTAKAVDVWGMKDGQQCVMQRQCSRDPLSDACRKDPCQAAVIEAMKSAGFCNLSSEAWHFEYPKMSTACN